MQAAMVDRRREKAMHKGMLGGRVRIGRVIGATAATAMCTLLGMSAEAQTANRVVGTCVLQPATISNLRADLQESAGIPNPRIDFVVIYTLANPNDGQPISGGFTGPVLCGRTAFGTLPLVAVAPVSQTDTIPASGTIDLLGIENALITQYKPTGGAASDTEKRFCHTTGANNDCFRISD